MNCAKLRTDLALHAGDDLAAKRVGRVESHLAECADCRALIAELREERELLGELRDDPLEETLAAQLHSRVMAEAAALPERAPVRYWKLAVAAALMVAAILLWPRQRAARTPVAPQAMVRAIPTASAQPVQTPTVVRRVRHRRRRPAAQPGSPLLVQLVTEDPNIVVYWLIDGQPQGE